MYVRLEPDTIGVMSTKSYGDAGMQWSLQPDFDLTPAPNVDTSLLAAGNKAGRV